MQFESLSTASLMFDITWMDEVTVQILHKRGQRLLGSVLETRVETGPGLGEAGALKYSELEAASREAGGC